MILYVGIFVLALLVAAVIVANYYGLFGSGEPVTKKKKKRR
jgi:hypothetical protein